VAIGLLAVVLATLNLVGGFVVTDRMLEMFKARPPRRDGPGPGDAAAGDAATGGTGTGGSGSRP